MVDFMLEGESSAIGEQMLQTAEPEGRKTSVSHFLCSPLGERTRKEQFGIHTIVSAIFFLNPTASHLSPSCPRIHYIYQAAF